MFRIPQDGIVLELQGKDQSLNDFAILTYYNCSHKMSLIPIYTLLVAFVYYIQLGGRLYFYDQMFWILQYIDNAFDIASVLMIVAMWSTYYMVNKV